QPADALGIGEQDRAPFAAEDVRLDGTGLGQRQHVGREVGELVVVRVSVAHDRARPPLLMMPPRPWERPLAAPLHPEVRRAGPPGGSRWCRGTCSGRSGPVAPCRRAGWPAARARGPPAPASTAT